MELKNNEQLLEESLQKLPLNQRSDIKKGEMNNFLGGLINEFYKKQVENFPALVEETRRVNVMHLQELAKHGNKTSTKMIGGKVYEGTSGWSKDFSMKHKWIVPTQLRHFMRNLVYVDFWDDENAKIRDKFMKDVIKGEDAYELLRKVKVEYGSNVN